MSSSLLVEQSSSSSRINLLKKPRKLGTYGTSAFKTPSRSQLESVEKRRKASSATTTITEDDDNQNADSHQTTATTTKRNGSPIFFSPLKSCFDKAASKESKGSVVAAQMRNSKPRFNLNKSHTGSGGDSPTKRNNSENTNTTTISPFEAAAEGAEDAKSHLSISARVTTAKIAGPVFSRQLHHHDHHKNNKTENTSSQKHRDPNSLSSQDKNNNNVALVPEDPKQFLTIGFRVKMNAESHRPDPVFANTAPRFRSLGSQSKNNNNNGDVGIVSSGAGEEYFLPKGIAELTQEKNTVRMSSNAAPRFVEKHSITERAEFYTPRGFADEILRKNNNNNNSMRSTTPPPTKNLSLQQPRFPEKEKLTSNCQMFIPRDGIADRVQKNASLAKNTSSFAKPTDVKEMRQKVEMESTAASKAVSPSWNPKTFVDLSLEKKDTAGFAFRSTTPRFVSRHSRGGGGGMGSSHQDNDELFKKAGLGEDGNEKLKESMTRARSSGDLSSKGRNSQAKPSPNFVSKIPRFGVAKRSSTILVDNLTDFVPESFVDKILRK